MADEAQQPKDDVIPLDSIMPGASSAPLGPTAQSENDKAAEAKPAAPPQPTGSADVDALLAVEDPGFAESLNELKVHAGEKGEIDIESLDAAQALKEAEELKTLKGKFKYIFRKIFGAIRATFAFLMKLPKVGLPLLKSGAKTALLKSKAGAIFVAGRAKSWLQTFMALPSKSKIALALAVALGGLAVFTLKWSLGGRVSVALGPKFLNSFADIADAKFSYSEHEPFEEFTDPLFHPEHVVGMDRVIVNLRTREGEGTPMGYFAFYFEATNQESAVELRDREHEVRDVVSRSLEQMSYAELSTVPGKEKLKVILRKNLNSLLSRGQVRRVYFKSFVLKQ